MINFTTALAILGPMIAVVYFFCWLENRRDAEMEPLSVEWRHAHKP